MKQLIAVFSLVLLAGCGGGDSNCLPASDFQVLVDNGTFTPRPALKPTDVWADPWVVGVTLGFPGGPPQISGPYYVAGEVPGFVCAP